jgi:hypothetical protein
MVSQQQIIALLEHIEKLCQPFAKNVVHDIDVANREERIKIYCKACKNFSWAKASQIELLDITQYAALGNLAIKAFDEHCQWHQKVKVPNTDRTVLIVPNDFRGNGN